MSSILDYNHNRTNYDHLIGEEILTGDGKSLGVIVEIDYFLSGGYQHEECFAVLGNGRRVNCRLLVSDKECE